jgi:hypothetical protein
MSEDIYEIAIREWIAHQIRGRGHHNTTRDDIRNIRHGVDQGWPGTEETAGDAPEASILYELRGGNGWYKQSEPIDDIAGFVRGRSAIVEHMRATSSP